jgi:two-component system nitrogen regulation sensor histidine kinase GlnL
VAASEAALFRVLTEKPHASSTLDMLDTAVIRLDSHSRILHMNSAAEQCLLISRDRAAGQSIEDVAEIPSLLSEVVNDAGQGDRVRHLHELKMGGGYYDCTVQSADGGDRLLEFSNLEWEKRRIRLEQRELQTGMLDLLSRNLGHEVRNPLGGIRGAAQMLAAELDNSELATLARLIMRESDRIDELIQRFGQPELNRQDLEVYPLLDEALELLVAEFGDSVQLDRDFDPSIPAINADASALRQVFLNLLRNACQAGADKIRIRTRVEHGSALLQTRSTSVLRLDVFDNGQGVPESLRSLLFLPLVTGRRDGTGLGLSLSQQIASAHGGLLAFEALEEGSCFTLFLPLLNGRSAPGPDSGSAQYPRRNTGNLE